MVDIGDLFVYEAKKAGRYDSSMSVIKVLPKKGMIF